MDWCRNNKEAKGRVSSLVSPLQHFFLELYADDDICFSFMHEAMHVIGFSHEFNRFDRDSYIKPLLKNIRKGRCSFLMYSEYLICWVKGFFLFRKQPLTQQIRSLQYGRGDPSTKGERKLYQLNAKAP